MISATLLIVITYMGNFMKKRFQAMLFSIAATLILTGYLSGVFEGENSGKLAFFKEAVAAEAESTASPVKALAERGVYYPG